MKELRKKWRRFCNPVEVQMDSQLEKLKVDKNRFAIKKTFVIKKTKICLSQIPTVENS